MDSGKLDCRRMGSVKAAITSFHVEANTNINNYSKKKITKTRNQSVIEEAESELSAAKKTVKELTRMIEESNSRTKGCVRDLEKTKLLDSYKCEKVMEELKWIKVELSKLHGEMTYVMEEKRKAEKEREDCISKMQSFYRLFEELNEKIGEINEEQILVVLAKMEALKEFEEIEAWRNENGKKYLALIDEKRKTKDKLVREIQEAKGIETKLAMALSDIDALEKEISKYKKMEMESVERNDQNDELIQVDNENNPDPVLLLDSLSKELEAAKKTLSSIKAESFQLMTSMDIIRKERQHVAEETAYAKKKGEKLDAAFQNLNSKLLRAKVKLQAATAAEETTKFRVSNLLLKLEQLKPITEASKKELILIQNEAKFVMEEVQKTENDMGLAEERFVAAMQDLKAAKESEAEALENLKELIENTLKNRASTSRRNSTITISRLEYEYLTGHAAGAKEIADKKIAASKAWVEALHASEREILIKIDILKREERLKQEEDAQKEDQILSENDVIADEIENWRQSIQATKLRSGNSLPSRVVNKSAVRRAPSLPSRSTNRSVRIGSIPAKRVKGARGSASPVFHATPRSTPFIVRKKRKVLPNLTKFFRKNATRNP